VTYIETSARCRTGAGAPKYRRLAVYLDAGVDDTVPRAIHPGLSMPLRNAPSRLMLAATLAALLALAPRAAQAGTQVEGTVDAVRVEAHDATLHDVLAALSATFGLRVQASAGLDQTVSGTFQGSLRQVVARLLASRNYVAKYGSDTIVITVFGTGGGSTSGGGTPDSGKARARSVVIPVQPTIWSGSGYQSSLTTIRQNAARNGSSLGGTRP
jgi:hypothetical protein